MSKIIIIGYGEHGRVISDLLKEDGIDTLLGYVDQNKNLKDIEGVWLGSDDQLSEIVRSYPDAKYIIGVAKVSVRRRIIEANRDLNLNYASIISSKAIVSPSATIGKGVVIMRGAMVNSEAQVGDHVIVNTGAIVEHESQLFENAQVSPGACMGGTVVLNEDAFIGLNATILLGKKVGKGAVVGAGAVVIDDVKEGNTVVGVPAKAVKP